MPKSTPEAFDVLIAPHLTRLFRAACRLAGNRADAEDLVQDTCLSACENLTALGGADYPERWLLRVLYHRFVDGTRRRRRAPVIAIDVTIEGNLRASDQSDPEEMAVQAERERHFHRAWSELPPIQRALLALRAEGYGLAEIETITGIGSEVLRARLHRARQSLARHLNQKRDVAALPSRLGSKP